MRIAILSFLCCVLLGCGDNNEEARKGALGIIRQSARLQQENESLKRELSLRLKPEADTIHALQEKITSIQKQSLEEKATLNMFWQHKISPKSASWWRQWSRSASWTLGLSRGTQYGDFIKSKSWDLDRTKGYKT